MFSQRRIVLRVPRLELTLDPLLLLLSVAAELLAGVKTEELFLCLAPLRDFGAALGDLRLRTDVLARDALARSLSEFGAFVVGQVFVAVDAEGAVLVLLPAVRGKPPPQLVRRAPFVLPRCVRVIRDLRVLAVLAELRAEAVRVDRADVIPVLVENWTERNAFLVLTLLLVTEGVPVRKRRCAPVLIALSGRELFLCGPCRGPFVPRRLRVLRN